MRIRSLAAVAAVTLLLAACGQEELYGGLTERDANEMAAVLKSQGRQLGRPSPIGADVAGRVIELRAHGGTWRAIAAAMEREGWPTATGGRWHPTTVRRIWLAEHREEA